MYFDSSDLTALINLWEEGLLLQFNGHLQPLYNRSFIEMWQVPEEVEDLQQSNALLTFISSKIRNPNAFLQRVRNFDPSTLAAWFEYVETEDRRQIEVSVQPVINHQGNFLGYLWRWTERHQLHQERQLQGYALLVHFVERMGAGFPFKGLLDQTMLEIRSYLKVDRAFLYYFDQGRNDGNGYVLSCSVGRDWDDDLSLFQSYLDERPELRQQFTQGRPWHFQEMPETVFEEPGLLFLEQLRVQAQIVFPILIEDRLWGLLVAQHCRGPRFWPQEEIELLDTLCTQIAMALQKRHLERELDQIKRQIEENTLVDELTLIGNQRRFEQALDQEWQRLAREQLPLSVIMCDVDYFKLYNDTFGFEGGNACLQQLSWALSLVCQRPADVVARYSGEEFAIVLPNTDLDGAVHMAEEILENIQKLNIQHPRSPISDRLTVSLGVSSIIPSMELLPDELVSAGTKALNQAKAKGGDRIIIQEVTFL